MFNDETWNLASLLRQAEFLNEMDADELNQNEILVLEQEFEDWLEVTASKDGTFKAQVTLHRLQHQRISRGTERRLLREAKLRIRARPDVILFLTDLQAVKTRYRQHVASSSASSSFSYSSSS